MTLILVEKTCKKSWNLFNQSPSLNFKTQSKVIKKGNKRKTFNCKKNSFVRINSKSHANLMQSTTINHSNSRPVHQNKVLIFPGYFFIVFVTKYEEKCFGILNEQHRINRIVKVKNSLRLHVSYFRSYVFVVIRCETLIHV